MRSIRCISLWQPWATLWLLSNPDEKVFETRDWYTAERGPTLVHAAKKKDGEVRDFLALAEVTRTLNAHGISLTDLAFGAIIGGVDLVGCSKMSRMPEPSEREQMWGNWAPHRFAWERGPDPILFRTPVPYRGVQKFFNVPAELAEEFTR